MTIVKDIYNSFFGKDFEPIWRQFSSENNGTYVIGKHDNLDSVEISYLNHKIIFDRYIHYQVVGGTSYDKEYTRVRFEYKSNDDLQFSLTNQGIFDDITKLFGAQDIQIGDSLFDSRFMIKGNDKSKIQILFLNDELRKLILSLDVLRLEIFDNEGLFNEKAQKGNVMLYYISEINITSIDQLQRLQKLFALFIDQLIKLDSLKASS